jgi:alkylhydroperoxidase family enzyme
MRASIGLYLAIMHGRSGLSRARREMLAVVVSKANGCHY